MEENKNKVEEDILDTQGEDTEATDCATEATEAEAEAEEVTEEAPLKHKDKKKLKKAEAEIENLNKKLLEEQEKYLRLMAEYENFRKRTAKERDGIYTDAYCDALGQILPIIDNLERAAQYVSEDPDSPMAKGIELTIKSCVDALNKMGVYEIEALGKQFDPNLHNAVMHVEDEAFGENEIVEVFMKGYVKGEKVLRFSMVKVAN